MIAITIGTTRWRQAMVLAGNEVAFTGSFVYDADGFTPLMLWDAGLGNVRAMTAGEIAAFRVGTLTAKAQAEKAAATASIDNGQLLTGQQYERLIRALALVVLDEINIIRPLLTTPQAVRTTAQLVSAIKAKIAATAE